MNWQRWLTGVATGVAMLGVVGTATAPLAARVPVAGVDVDANPPAWGITAVNDDASFVNDHSCTVNSHASDGMPSSTAPGPGSLPWSAVSNAYWGCDDAMVRGLRPDNGYALGESQPSADDQTWNQGATGSADVRNGNGHPESQPSTDDQPWNRGAPGSPNVHNSNGYPESQTSTDDQPSGWSRNVAGWTSPLPFWAPQFTQWPTAPGTDPLRTAEVYSILDAPDGGRDQNGVIVLGIDPESLPPDNGPTTNDELSCPPSCHDEPVATNGSPSAVAEPATLSLLGLGMLAFAGLRRRALGSIEYTSVPEKRA